VIYVKSAIYLSTNFHLFVDLIVLQYNQQSDKWGNEYSSL